jgi:hypothetical protein
LVLADDEQFKEGQKLEAVDPLEMSRICPATIGKVSVRNKHRIFEFDLGYRHCRLINKRE